MPRRLRDVDAGHRVNQARIVLWSIALGLMMGAPIGGFVADRQGVNAIAGAMVGALVVGLAVYKGSSFLVEGAATTAQMINLPSGDSTPYKTDFSHAASLVLRGRYEDAAAAYEVQCSEHPEDPEPYLRLAWLYRDNLQRFDEALTWFQRARADARLSSPQHLLVIQEIVDLYVHRLKQPRRAIPELAQLCEKFPGSPGAEAAGKQLRQMRDMLDREREGLAPFTEQFLESVGKKSAAEAAGDVERAVEIEGIRSALRSAGGDAAKAAKELGLSPYDLAARMDALRMNDTA